MTRLLRRPSNYLSLQDTLAPLDWRSSHHIKEATTDTEKVSLTQVEHLTTKLESVLFPTPQELSLTQGKFKAQQWMQTL